MLLALLLRHRRTYDQVAAVLEAEPAAIRRRAQRALRALAPAQAEEIPPRRFGELCDLLLGQGPSDRRLLAYDRLLSDERALAFARAVAARLGEQDPDLGAPLTRLLDAGQAAAPSGRERPANRTGARPRLRRPSLSRPPLPRLSPPAGKKVRGGLVLVICAGAIAGVLLGVGVFEEPASAPLRAAGTQTATTASAAQTRPLAEVKLQGSGGASGEALIASVGGTLKVALQGKGLPPSGSHTYYIVWLYTSPSSYYPVGRAPSVGSNGVLPAAATELPSDAASYKELIVTRESSPEPQAPGEVVLRGPLELKGG